jgi:hypothetical protein
MAAKQMALAESLSLGLNSKCENGEVQIKKHARWYIYGTHVVSKLTFTDEYGVLSRHDACAK